MCGTASCGGCWVTFRSMKRPDSNAFVDEALLDMKRKIGESLAEQYSRAGRLDYSWQGLSRYWRKRLDGQCLMFNVQCGRMLANGLSIPEVAIRNRPCWSSSPCSRWPVASLQLAPKSGSNQRPRLRLRLKRRVGTRAGEPIVFAGNYYYPAGPAIHFLANEMVPTGSYRGIQLYSRTTIEPYSVVFVPVAGGLMQPYERRRAGDLAGTTGSSVPSFPVEIPSAFGTPPVIQAQGPPFVETNMSNETVDGGPQGAVDVEPVARGRRSGYDPERSAGLSAAPRPKHESAVRQQTESLSSSITHAGTPALRPRSSIRPPAPDRRVARISRLHDTVERRVDDLHSCHQGSDAYAAYSKKK